MLRRHFMINTKSDISNIPNDEIWYTSSDGNIVTPYSTSALPTIVSNTYNDGKGIIKFTSDITSIGANTFYNRSSLTSITIPNSVTSIVNAFAYCSKLTSVNADENNPNYSSIDGVLFNKNKTTLVVYPIGKRGAYIIPNSVTNIKDSAFYGCSYLNSIDIPNSVTNIGDHAFYACVSLKSVTIPNSVINIGKYSFHGCKNLISMSISNSITFIGEGAFYGCTKLTSITYIGTISQWNAIAKIKSWNTNVPATVVHCTDGDAEL